MTLDAIRPATPADVAAITELVNLAYRPQPDSAGWTHESGLVGGDRTNLAQVAALLARPDSVVLLGLQGPFVVACVHVEKEGQDAMIGMLAVDPRYQTGGVGKQMLAQAEAHAMERFGALRFLMAVVSSRAELIAFYLRRGYVRTGEVMDYPLSAGAGIPLSDALKIEVLSKPRLPARDVVPYPAG